MMTRKPNQARQQKSAKPNRWLISGAIVVIAAAAVMLILAETRDAEQAVALELSERDPVLGKPDAPVTIIEYGAYGCSACRAWHRAGIIDQILAAYPDQVRFVFRDFPVIVPSYDRMAAGVAQCALDQGLEKFWAYHDVLYQDAYPGNSREDLIQLGASADLDVNSLRACAEAETHSATVAANLDQGRQLGLPGTPSFLVNGQRVFDASPEALVRAVDRALDS